MSQIDLFLPKHIYGQSGAAANFGDRAHRYIWGSTVNNDIYIVTHEHSFTGFEQRLALEIVKFGKRNIGARNSTGKLRHFGSKI